MANSTRPVTTTTRNARTVPLVAIASALVSGATAGNAATTTAARTARRNACTAVAGTAGSGAVAATAATAGNAAATVVAAGTARHAAVIAATATSRNGAATAATVKTASNVAVTTTTATVIARNAVDVAATSTTTRNAAASVAMIAVELHPASAATVAKWGGQNSTSKRSHRRTVRGNRRHHHRDSCQQQQQQQQQQGVSTQPLLPTPAASQPPHSVGHPVCYASQPFTLPARAGTPGANIIPVVLIVNGTQRSTSPPSYSLDLAVELECTGASTGWGGTAPDRNLPRGGGTQQPERGSKGCEQGDMRLIKGQVGFVGLVVDLQGKLSWRKDPMLFVDKLRRSGHKSKGRRGPCLETSSPRMGSTLLAPDQIG